MKKVPLKRVGIALDDQSIANLKRLQWRMGLNGSAVIRVLLASAATESEEGTIRLTL